MKQETQDQALAKDFDQYLTDIMSVLNEKMEELEKEDTLPNINELKQSVIMDSKHNLIRLCYNKVRDYIEMQAP